MKDRDAFFYGWTFLTIWLSLFIVGLPLLLFFFRGGETGDLILAFLGGLMVWCQWYFMIYKTRDNEKQNPS